MAASTISRATWTDDSGAGTDGTIINNARLQADVYDKIDAMFAGSGSYTTFEFGGGVKIDGVTELAGYKETATSISISSNVLTVNLALGSYFYFSLNANITTTTISNIPASGKFASFVLEVTADGTLRTWSWFTSTVKWDGGTAPTLESTNNKVSLYVFYTRDGGTTWRGALIGRTYA